MDKKKQLNYAQAMLIGAACQIEDDEKSEKINKWLYRHKILSGIIWGLYLILVTPITVIAGFIRPADGLLASTESAVCAAVMSNDEINKGEA